MIEAIERAITQSSFIVKLEEDWDGEGSPAMRPVTWERATSFLRGIASTIMQKTGLAIDAPEITPAADGSIDIHWRVSNFAILINIAPEGFCDFHGEVTDGKTIEGTFKPEERHGELISWLSERNWSTSP
jgi:hypothetical protein